MLNRLVPNIVRRKYRPGSGGVFGMRSGAIVCAVWIMALSACAFPAAAQDAGAPADSAAAAADAEVNPQADVPLTPEESAALGSALTVDAADLAGSQPVKPLRLPSLNDPNKFDISHSDRPDGSSTLSVKQPLASEWDAKVGADLSLAAAPADGATPSKPFALKPAGRDSGAAWASVGVADLATVDARVDPGSDQSKLGTTFKRSIPVGGKFSVTLQDSYSMTATFGAAAPAPSDLPPMTEPAATPAPATQQIWGSQKAVKLDVLTTGTSLGAGVATASNDPVTHNTFSADQKLYGPLHLTTAVNDVGQPTISKRISAAFRLTW
jgi:hypothetical protein